MAQDLATSVELLTAAIEAIPADQLGQADSARLVASLNDLARLCIDHASSQTRNLNKQVSSERVRGVWFLPGSVLDRRSGAPVGVFDGSLARRGGRTRRSSGRWDDHDAVGRVADLDRPWPVPRELEASAPSAADQPSG